MVGVMRRSFTATAVAVAVAVSLVACGGPEEQAADTEINQAVTWQGIKGFQVPVSDIAGPQDATSTPPAGYSQTVFGAALAAAGLSISLDTADEKSFGQVLNKATVDDEGRRQWAAARAGLIVGQTQKDRVPVLEAWAGQLADNSLSAEVYLYWRQYDGSLTEQRREVEWQGEDWKLKLPHNPQTPQLRAVADIPDEAFLFEPPSK